ncbi:hypothetical protein KIH75_04180 [Bifidobacterium sp. 64T4]|uniref:hypothetical protein n=1 Tax=Bifidobacterium pongonis TaxID=2834432 RepID=UPI001C578E58|nr:hypothetical protein [Bifidobacterium pongonis]MBW3094551.1 hypothetical protein [Bifidobacterium pongonis]
MGSNKPHRLRRFVRTAVATLAAIAATATMGVSSAQASVDSPSLANGEAWTGGVIADFYGSGYDRWFGSYNVGNEKGYCYESNAPAGNAAQYASPSMGWKQKEDTLLSRRIGWLLREGQKDDALGNAGVAYAIHQLSGIDIGDKSTIAKVNALPDSTPVGLWHNVSVGGTRRHEGDTTLGAVRQKATQLWAQSETEAKSGTVNVKEIQYTDAQRHLRTKEIWFKDGNGQFASTDVIVTLDSNAKFDVAANGMYGGTVSADGKTWTGKTQPNLGAAGLQLPYTATGDGEAKYTVKCRQIWYTYQYPQNPQGFQHMAKRGSANQDPVKVESHAYRVQWSFQPQATTVADPKRLEPGDTPVDKVTSSVGDLISGTGADGTTHNTWNAGTKVKAEGYYYASEDESVLRPVKRDANETVDQYLARLNGLYGEPVATGSTEFTGSGQTNTVRARADGGDYTVPSDMAGYYGTWVWVIRKDAQEQPDRITADFVAEAGDKNEATLHHTRLLVSSQTANATITNNGELADRITQKLFSDQNFLRNSSAS